MEGSDKVITWGFDTVLLLNSLTDVSNAALVPSVGRNVNGLVNIRCQIKLVTGARATTPVPSAGAASGGVVKHKEVSLMPIRHIVVDVGLLDLVVVVGNGHPDDTIIGVRGVANLILQGLSPVSTSVAISAVEAICAMRVSHLDEFLAVVESVNTEHNVSVTHNKIITVSSAIAGAWGSSLDDIIFAVML